MNLSDNTILITGGTSGIGFELASQLLKLGNTVIITGRNQARLEAAQGKLPGVHTVQSDASDPQAIQALYAKVTAEFPELNILINNAGIMRRINLHDEGCDLEDLTAEIETNLNGPIRMAKQFLPHLKARKAAAIMNVSSGLAFVPLPISPVYCATKAGLHSFTQSLRVQLKNTHVKVFELAPPLTETNLIDGFDPNDMKDVKAMGVVEMVNTAIKGMNDDRFEIRPGQANALKLMSRVAPQFILNQLSKSADSMLAETK
ncbi:MAG: SDR family NAD(P)-dependent oxidoreductase [Candidatus Sericytochromatia bacterium]|nr:SDR family NAD(P)-dependent oxidoreductase [Candidatus Sericytochromatia bacterium]